MKTNEIKKGMIVELENGWFGKMFDNMRGNTRMVEVYGLYTEIGSVYSHDIIACFGHVSLEQAYENGKTGEWVTIEHTEPQKKLRKQAGYFDSISTK